MYQGEFVKCAVAAIGLALAAPASASVYDISDSYRIVPVEFNGVVTSSITDNIVVRLPDGSTLPYTGPVPDYPFDTGDSITIGFDAVVPTADAIAGGLIPAAADGIYRFQIGPRPDQLDNFPGTASYINFRGNGGIADTGSYSTDGGLFIVYDANTDSYSIDPSGGQTGSGSDTFGIGFFDFPVLAYDVVNDTIFNSSLQTLFPNRSGAAWSGTGTNTGRVPGVIYNFDGSTFLGGTPVGARSGGDVSFSGGWNLPIFGQDPTPVPAPGMLALFAFFTVLIMGRSRGSSRQST